MKVRTVVAPPATLRVIPSLERSAARDPPAFDRDLPDELALASAASSGARDVVDNLERPPADSSAATFRVLRVPKLAPGPECLSGPELRDRSRAALSFDGLRVFYG